MSTSRVVRFLRTDNPDTFVLVHVTAAGPKSLDLSLSATEGESPYTAVVKKSRLKDFRAKNYQGSEDEWAQIVSYILGEPIPADQLASISGIEATASITGSGDEDREIVLAIRKRVQSITQRLGTLVLKQDDEQAIELFEWTGIAAAKANELQNQVTELADRHNGFEEKIKQLTEQLEELIRVKTEHENQLLANFVQILNEKKLKIRNQQRLLATATADSARVAEIQAATGSVHETSHEIHALKRRAQDIADTDGDTDDGFEQMDVDKKKPDIATNDEETDDGGQFTPEHSENEEDEDEDEEEEEEEEDKKEDNEINNNNDGKSTEVGQRPSPKDHSPPPPRRELPFTRRGQLGKVKSPVAKVMDETDGESDDDEL
ncbi:hypothetical protein N7495_000675 [Penicillium taxi]|uniref:uncharacterized protein n=1 Tax=Penicillium taxi TaxID=168475 RepID=UPI0025450F51|nr:uncharacterized protein N7495_000675 [Penicillium taxi]KAJ5907993.1 hypothetical protein N7495_000675 [Penicillium taxi]